MSERFDVAVVGAGIVGICTAAYLQRDGLRVALLDPEPPGTMTSFGNAGAISAGSCVPMSGPGILRQVPKWLADPLGPLAVRWSYLPVLLPWLTRFVAAGSSAKVAAQARALRALHAPVVEAYEPLVEAAGARDLIRRNGGLYVYETERAFEADARTRQLMRDNGVEVQELSEGELRQMEPDLGPLLVRGVFLPDNAHTVDPGGLCRAIADMFQRNGGTVLRQRVGAFEIGPEGPRAALSDRGRLEADRFVVAAGAWSHRLAEQLGDRIPLESERGYHMTLPAAGVTTARPISFVERRFMCTPMAMGLRLAGTVEFAGLEAPPNWKRADRLLDHARQLFRRVDTAGASRWMGQRPATPDSLPVIGRATRFPNVLYAFGHGHLGLTGGAVTGRHIADLVAGRPPAIDLTPFRPGRF